MRYLICTASAVVCFMLFQSAKAQVDTSFHIYLLAGQSNMAGRGIVDDSSRITDPRILMLNKNGEWVPAKDPVHYDKPIAGVGPAISFARTMIGFNPDIKIGLVPAAVGGSPISAWQPDSVFIGYHPYDDAVSRANTAMQSGVIKGILWLQGETDNKPGAESFYLNALSALIRRLRTDLNIPALPFIAGELGPFHNQRINKILAKLPATVPNTAVVSSEGLTANSDNIHFNTPSARILGRRYAEKMIALEQKTY